MSASTDIAVIGAACRFPDATNVDEFWANLDAGVVSTRELPGDRDLLGAGTHPGDDAGLVRVAARVPGVDMFAAEFFGYAPAQAELIDPAHRLLLEVCWEALESAAHPPDPHGPLVGVFVGGGVSPYSSLLQASMIQRGGRAAIEDMDFNLGSAVDYVASRVAYKLGLRGPSITVSTACSSSLTAVHYAVLSLLSGECDIALAGGTSSAEPLLGYRYVAGGIMSHDGVCRPFDARSTGTGAGAGTGVVVLRRLEDALRDGDHVLAVVRGSAVGNDGDARPGFTAPSPAGVADVVATALRTAGVRGGDLDYVEAHGSGTALGDRIELRGLIEGVRAAGGADSTNYCGLGSVKANIGHAGWAAGVAGLLKAVHIAHTGRLAPHPTFHHPRDPGVLDESPFVISAELSEAPARPDGCHVLVNSMGLGGVNAAVVVGPPPAATGVPDEPVSPGPARLLLSARTRAELDEMSRRLAAVLEAGAVRLADVVHTLRVGRATFAERRVVSAPADRLAAALRLPRPPAVQTRRPQRCRLVLAGRAPAAPLAELLTSVAGGRLESLPDVPDTPPPGTFLLILAGAEDPPVGRDAAHAVLAVDENGAATPDALEAALVCAWLNGVDVRFDALPAVGRRVPLPTYPFRRSRHWALDRLPPPQHGTPAAVAPPPNGAAPGADPVLAALRGIWADLFGADDIGFDDEFGQLGGNSLLSVRMALEVQQRLGVLVNLHRAGGSRTTIRRLAEVVSSSIAAEETADGDGSLVDRDVAVDLGEFAPVAACGTEVLLTGATGYVGAFLLHFLLRATDGPVHCLVRGGQADSWARLREAAWRFGLPQPDPDRVHVVTGDLRDIGRTLDANGLGTRVGHVVHCAARVVFTEPYRVLREENVLASVELVRWMRRHGIADLSFVSSLAATGVSHDGKVTEDWSQPLDPEQGGYGVGKWVMERVLERAALDGMRVRVFRPGLLLGSTQTGGCNAKDMVWKLLASAVGIGAHPLDDRPLPLAPVDVVARAIVELGLSPASAGRAYNLVGAEPVSVRRLFALLGEAGLTTEGLPPDVWQQRVLSRARATGDEILASMTLFEQSGHDYGGGRIDAAGWRRWLSSAGLDVGPTGDGLRRSLDHLAATDASFGRLLAPMLAPASDRAAVNSGER